MPNQNYIPKVKKGANSIQADTLNDVIDSVNRVNKLTFDPTANQAQLNDGTDANNINIRDEKNHPFKLGTSNSQTLSITKGSWTRDQTEVELVAGSDATQDELIDDQILVSIDDFKDAGVATKTADTDYYVYVQLLANTDTTTYEFDESLIPGELNVLVDLDADTANQRSPSYVNDNLSSNALTEVRDLWIKDKEVIGTVQLGNEGSNWYIKQIKQLKDEDIEDYQIVPDYLAKTRTAEGRFRSTIQTNRIVDTTNSGSTIHFGELQLADLERVAEKTSVSIPKFTATSESSSLVGPAGALSWAVVDTYYALTYGGNIPAILTHDFVRDEDTNHKPDQGAAWSATNSYELFTLHNVIDTPIFSDSVCYYNSINRINDQFTQGTLQWASIDSRYRTDTPSFYTQDSIGLTTDDGYAILQLFEFNSPSAYSLDDDDLVLMRDADGPTLSYATKSDFVDWIEGELDCNFVLDCLSNNCETLETVLFSDCDLCQMIEDNCDTDLWGRQNHTDLVDIDAGGYVDHDHGNYWQNIYSVSGDYDGTASWDYAVNNGDSIGDSSPNLVIDLNGEQLVQAGSTFSVDWANCELDDPSGSLWEVLAGNHFNILDTTSPAKGLGWDAFAFNVKGGALIGDDSDYIAQLGCSDSAGYFYDSVNAIYANLCSSAKGSIFNDGSGTVTLTDGTNGAFQADDGGTTKVLICDGLSAGYFADNGDTYTANLGVAGSCAGFFEDGATQTYICDGTYSVYAVNNIRADGTYWASDMEGDSVDDGGNYLFAGGIFTNEDGWNIMTIQVPDGAGGTKDIKVLAIDA